MCGVMCGVMSGEVGGVGGVGGAEVGVPPRSHAPSRGVDGGRGGMGSRDGLPRFTNGKVTIYIRKKLYKYNTLKTDDISVADKIVS